MERKLDLRILKTYKLLKESFIQLMNQKRFEEITVNEICQNAMVRRATFYKHFADKYEFFGFIIKELQQDFEEALPQSEYGEEIMDFYIRIIRHFSDFLIENEKMVFMILTSSMLPTLLNILSEQIIADFTQKIKTKAKEQDMAQVNAELLASFYTGAMIYTMKYWLMQKNKMTQEELIHQVIDIIKNAPHPL